MDRKQKELDAKIGTKIKDMEFLDVDGVRRKLSSFIPQNGYLYIDLWSSGCAPCIAEFPELERHTASIRKRTGYPSDFNRQEQGLLLGGHEEISDKV